MRKSQLYIALIAFLIASGIIITWIVKIVNEDIPYVDQWTRGFVEVVAGTSIFTIARVLTELGSESFLIPFTIVMALLLWWIFRDFLPALIFSGGTLITHLINMWIKGVVARERPRIDVGANAEGYSFPSGHSMISMVCYGLLMYFLLQKVKTTKAAILIQISFSLLIFLIGISRYIINVHYLTDVLTGFTVGFIFLYLYIQFFLYIQKKRIHGGM